MQIFLPRAYVIYKLTYPYLSVNIIFMGKIGHSIAKIIVKYRLFFVILFVVAAVVCAVLMNFVKINFDSSSYLPANSNTKKGMTEMQEEFGENGNASAMFLDVSVEEALVLKDKIINTEGIKDVFWLDDLFDSLSSFFPASNLSKAKQIDYIIHIASLIPENSDNVLTIFSAIYSDDRYISDQDYRAYISSLAESFTKGGESFDISTFSGLSSQLSTFYNENSALFQISFTGTDYDDSTLNAIEKIYAYGDCHFFGNAATTYSSAYVVETETNKALVLVAVIILLILIVSSSSWWEPVIFLICIGVAVLINMGTNLILGQISYLTQGVACILQLALTMDYSVFLLSRYKQQRDLGMDAEEAMVVALTKSFSPVSASSLTTVAGFIAIMFMSYTIGFDMGLVLSKGVIFSLLSVFLLMPALIIYSHKLIEKTTHKTFNFSSPKFGRFLVQTRHVLPVIILLVIGASFVLQSMNTFTYGNESSMCSEGSLYMLDKDAIEEKFGTQNQLAILLPREYYSEEKDICEELSALENVDSVQSLSLIESSGMKDLLPDKFISQFYKENGKYTRIVCYISVPEEGEETLKLINSINTVISESVPNTENVYALGNSPATIEIKSFVEKDYSIITFISMILVAAVLLISFRSISIPIILVAVIEGSIWINLSVSALSGHPLVFLGYLIVSSILLGATIDYAILLTSHYMEARKTEGRFKAAEIAVEKSLRAIIISAGIFCCAGFTIGLISSMPTISDFGYMIGRGGISAFILVTVLLPQFLIIADKVIMVTTLHAKNISKKKVYVPKIKKASPLVRVNINQSARMRTRRKNVYEERNYKREYDEE